MISMCKDGSRSRRLRQKVCELSMCSDGPFPARFSSKFFNITRSWGLGTSSTRATNFAPYVETHLGFLWSAIRGQRFFTPGGKDYGIDLPNRGEGAFTMAGGVAVDQRLFNLLFLGVAVRLVYAFGPGASPVSSVGAASDFHLLVTIVKGVVLLIGCPALADAVKAEGYGVYVAEYFWGCEDVEPSAWCAALVSTEVGGGTGVLVAERLLDCGVVPIVLYQRSERQQVEPRFFGLEWRRGKCPPIFQTFFTCAPGRPAHFSMITLRRR